MWMDGNIHAGEVTGRQLMMYFVEAVLASYGKDSIVTRLVDTRTFYVMPIFDADGGESRLTQYPAWPEHESEEHRGKDLDGDGYVTRMRVKDPEGDSYPSSIDPRLMLRVRDRTGGRWGFVPTTLTEPETFEEDLVPRDQRYRVYTEGASLERPVTDEREPANFNHLGSHVQPDDSVIEQVYDEKTYYGYSKEGLTPHLREVVHARDPERIAVNTSKTLPEADGLTATLKEFLIETVGSPYADRLVSAELLVRDFRTRRAPLERKLFTELAEWTARWETEGLTGFT